MTKAIYTSAEAHRALSLEEQMKLVRCRNCNCILLALMPEVKVTSLVNLICRKCRHFMRYKPFAEKTLQKAD